MPFNGRVVDASVAPHCNKSFLLPMGPKVAWELVHDFPDEEMNRDAIDECKAIIDRLEIPKVYLDGSMCVNYAKSDCCFAWTSFFFQIMKHL